LKDGLVGNRGLQRNGGRGVKLGFVSLFCQEADPPAHSGEECPKKKTDMLGKSLTPRGGGLGELALLGTIGKSGRKGGEAGKKGRAVLWGRTWNEVKEGPTSSAFLRTIHSFRYCRGGVEWEDKTWSCRKKVADTEI